MVSYEPGYKPFKGRKAERVEWVPPPVVTPPPEIRYKLDLSEEEFAVLKEAAYFYWASREKAELGEYWYNPLKGKDYTNLKTSRIAQSFYDDYASGFITNW